MPIRAAPGATTRLARPIDTPPLQFYAFIVHKIPVGVLGASGYAGRELCALVSAHPGLELALATAHSRAGETARFGAREVTFVAPDDVALDRAALVFSALPHGASRAWVERAREAGAKVVDLSSDLRPGYGAAGVPYGMPELGDEARRAIRDADLVANPGCYPTSILLALAPLLAAGLVPDDATIVANSASGVTGAGNSPKRELLFAELSEDFRAYGVGNTHRHLTEMRATLDAFGSEAELVFTPHLLPVARGILSTITIPLTEALADATAFYRDAYARERFVEVSDAPPYYRDA
jgi:N-acetyl-gamma-glutamyl-phosphate reductase